MSRLAVMVCGLLLMNLAGCQCCRLFDHYADVIDCTSDHEHHFEVLYHPALDLNRIGRRDWCSCRINRALCRCACDRCRPVACEYSVIAETGRVFSDTPVSQPDWAEETDPLVEESELSPDDVPQRAEDDLLLPPPPVPPPAPEGEEGQQ